MLKEIRAAAETDPGLAGVYARAEEYAAIYRMTRERQKGCDGLGELNDLKDELRWVLEEMVAYGRQSGLLAGCDLSDIDRIIDGFCERVIGVDMTPEMIERARENAQKVNLQNVEFRLGEIENLPVDSASVDAVISNCVVRFPGIETGAAGKVQLATARIRYP